MFRDISQDVFSAVAHLRGKVTTTTGYNTVSFRLREGQSGTYESHNNPEARATSVVACCTTPKRKCSNGQNRQHFHVDGQHDIPSMARFVREATGVCHQPCCRNPGTNNSG